MQTAQLDGKEVIAWDLTAQEFQYLRHCYRKDPDRLRFRDGLHAIPRGGPLRANHFAHRKGESGGGGAETQFHILAKRAIHAVASAKGWSATLEVAGPDRRWQADVLLEKKGRRIAFEIQWSPQSMAEFQRRSDRYASDGVETVWLARSTMRSLTFHSATVQMIPFNADGAGRDTIYPLSTALEACLDVLEEPSWRSIAEPILRQRCDSCGGSWFSTGISELWGDKRDFTPYEREVLCSWAGSIHETYSRRAGKRYPMWHCPHCKSKFGDFYLDHRDRNIVHEGKVIPDVRGVSLWDAIVERLATHAELSAGVADVEGEESRFLPGTTQPRANRIGSGNESWPTSGAVTPESRSVATRCGGSVTSEETRAALDAIAAEGVADTRRADDPERIRAFYERLGRAAQIYGEEG